MRHGLKQTMLQVTTLSPSHVGVRLAHNNAATVLSWRMRAMPDWTDLPNDSTALARIAITSESGDLRDAAWLRLIPIINRIASEASRAYHCEEIEEEAVGYVWEKLQEGKFEPER